MISDTQLAWLQRLISQDRLALFYQSAAWHRVRAEVLRLDCGECQICKAKGRFSRAALVHHVKHLDQRPDLALSVFDPETGERQLLSVCKACHEALHPESLRRLPPRRVGVTRERWD